MPSIDLSILNQRQTPAFFADTLANRPAPSYVGRIFISTDTLDLYRDTGSAWLLLSPSSTGTITGSGAAGQVTIFSGASSITGTNNLFWDTTNLRLGINTNTPGASLDVHSAASSIAQFNQTTATNDTRIAFQNSGVAKWRIGSFYNLGSNDYAVNDATLNINRFTIKSSSGQTFVGDETTSSGLFVVNNSSADAHLVVLGATAPSLRVRNAGVGASLQFGLGLATTTNNFIQGATGGEFCIFNDSLTAQPILFGIKDAGLGNTQEAARFSAARNFLVGTSVDAGYKLSVNGTSLITGAASFSNNLTLDSSTNPTIRLNGAAGGAPTIRFDQNGVNKGWVYLTSGGILQINNTAADGQGIAVNGNNVGIGTSTPTSLFHVQSSSQIRGRFYSTGAASFLDIENGGGSFYVGKDNAAGSDFGVGAYANCIWGATSYPIVFANNNLERFRVSTSGNLLIGTTTDAGYKLDVNGKAQVTGVNNDWAFRVLGSSTTGQSLGLRIAAGTSGADNVLYFTNADSTRVILNGWGDGTTFMPSVNLFTTSNAANIYIDNVGKLFLSTSSKKYKNNIIDYDKGINIVNKLRPVYYNGNNDGDKKFAGLIAEEVHDLGLTEFVQYAADGTPNALAYSNMIALLVKAIQELNTKIENLK